jgi:hypothetical protein
LRAVKGHVTPFYNDCQNIIMGFTFATIVEEIQQRRSNNDYTTQP